MSKRYPSELQIRVLDILRKGPMCFSELATRVHCPSSDLRQALESLPNLLERREAPFLEDDDDAEIWGIIPAFWERKKQAQPS